MTNKAKVIVQIDNKRPKGFAFDLKSDMRSASRYGYWCEVCCCFHEVTAVGGCSEEPEEWLLELVQQDIYPDGEHVVMPIDEREIETELAAMFPAMQISEAVEEIKRLEGVVEKLTEERLLLAKTVMDYKTWNDEKQDRLLALIAKVEPEEGQGLEFRIDELLSAENTLAELSLQAGSSVRVEQMKANHEAELARERDAHRETLKRIIRVCEDGCEVIGPAWEGVKVLLRLVRRIAERAMYELPDEIPF